MVAMFFNSMLHTGTFSVPFLGYILRQIILYVQQITKDLYAITPLTGVLWIGRSTQTELVKEFQRFSWLCCVQT